MKRAILGVLLALGANTAKASSLQTYFQCNSVVMNQDVSITAFLPSGFTPASTVNSLVQLTVIASPEKSGKVDVAVSMEALEFTIFSGPQFKLLIRSNPFISPFPGPDEETDATLRMIRGGTRFGLPMRCSLRRVQM